MNRKINIAVVGATGAVGREIFQIIEERDFQFENLDAIASKKSEGRKINFRDI